MKLIFAGTPPFAVAALAALHAAGHEIALVLTQPDRPAGRGQMLKPSTVAVEAARLRLPVEKPPTLKEAQVQARMSALRPDLIVVAAYGLLLPQAVLDIPLQGCLNIHGSLLPRWRGAAPVQRAIEAGDHETGIDIMVMDAGLDTGPVLLEKKVPIDADETAESLFAKLAAQGAQAIVEALARLPTLTARAQPTAGVTHARKIEKSEARIDWAQPADVIERRIRAFDPFPGAETSLHGAVENDRLKIWRAAPIALSGSSKPEPGLVLAHLGPALIVACGVDALEITQVQRPGGRRQPIAEYLRAHPIAPGALLQ